MDIRQLHYFLVLCEEMNYTRAAQRLFLSRQALRQSISALEAELCGPLFLSAHHKLSLTDRGVSLQRHAAPVVEQFQQMQAALHAEIQSAQPVRIGISVSLVPDYLPGLETQLDKFRQQYPHIEMRFRLLDNDAVAEGVEQGELDAGLVMDLGCAAPVLARTTLRADPACLLVPRGHPFWERESVPLAELRNQRVLLPSLRQDLFAPLWEACARAGFAPNAEIGPSFYQAYYLVQEQLCTCLTRYEPGARRELDRVRDVLLEDLPPLCVSLLQRRDHASAYIDLLRSYLMEVLGGAASGKSEYAESLVLKTALPRYYLATMQVWDAECAARVEKHRKMRAEKQFETLECPLHLDHLALPGRGTVLLEDLGNLVANELYSPGGAGKHTAEAVLAGLERLAAGCDNLIVVSNEVFSGGADYAGDTDQYLLALAQVNNAFAARADNVCRVVCGLPVYYKGGEKL